MAIALRANGTWIDSTGNLTPVIPTGVPAGDIMICSYGTKPYSDAPTINNGWTLIGSATDGTVAAGIDAGSMKTVMWYKIHTGTETNPTITNTTNSVSSARIDVYSCTSGVWVTPVGSGGGDATAGTGFSVTVSDVGWKQNDAALIMSSFRSDASTVSTMTMTHNGAGYSLGSMGGITGFASTSGQDMFAYFSQMIFGAYVGPATSIVITATLGAAHTGSLYLVRLRENSAPTTVLNTPINGATAQANTPTLSFTGTDFDSNTIEYNIEIDILNTFDSLGIGFSLFSFSSITDAGFTAGHPFTSGVQKSYTVQSALNDSTVYYWRVRGIDPNGGNVYGAWSSIYSFTTSVGSPQYNESISLSSANSISAFFDAILVASITLSSDNTVVNTSIADLLAVANVSSVNQMSAINNLISEVSATISQDSTISNIGGLDFNNTITLSSDNAIVPLLELILNQSTSLGIDTQISKNSNLDGVANVLLLSDNMIIPVPDLIINQNTAISIDTQISEIGNIDMVPTTTISQDSQIASVTNLDAQNNIGLQTDNVFVGASSLIINSIAILQSDSVIVNSNNVSMSEALNFTTDSSLLDNNISSLVNDIVYLIDGQVSFTYDGFAEIVAQLIALSQLNISNTADILSQIELQIDNQVVFDLFMEAYSIINLSGETATTFDIVSVINTVFDLNISSDILIEIASVINNNVTFSISTGIEAIDELSLSSNTYFENTILNIIVSISFIDGLGTQIQGLKIIGALFLKNINTIK